jgi:hypothetical protein
MAKSGGGLFKGIGRTGRADAGANDLRLHIDCDDIQAIWARFPGLADGITNDSLPLGMLVVDDTQLQDLAKALPTAAAAVADALMGPVDHLRATWTSASGPPDRPAWATVCDVLVGGLGLGCAVPRQVAWRAPAAFVRAPATAAQTPPPFLQFVFLPGAGSAGLALTAASATAPVDRVVARSAGGDWAQTWQSYTGRDGDMTAYGLAGQALVAAGILRRRGVSLQARSTLAAPVVGRQDLLAVEAPWHCLIAAARDAVNAQQDQLGRAIQVVFGGTAIDGVGPDGDAVTSAMPCDYLDAAYFVLADLVYSQIAASSRSTGRPPQRPSKVNAVVFERPAELWQWLLEADSPDA